MNSKQIREKAARIVKAHHTTARKKGEPPFKVELQDEIHPQTTVQLLEAVHQEALRPSSHLHQNLASSISLFMCRCAVQEIKKHEDADSKMQRLFKRTDGLYQRTKDALADVGDRDSGELLSRSFWDEYQGWKRTMLQGPKGGSHANTVGRT